MANLSAVASDGVSLVYIAATGSGTNQDPFVVTNALSSGTVVGLDSASLAALENITATISGTIPVSGTVSVGNFPATFSATQSGAWTVAVNNFPATQPVSASSLPLPTGAATADNQSIIIGHIDGIEGLLGGGLTVNTGLTPLTDTQLRASAVPVTGTVTANTGLSQPLTDAQLRATPIPVSGTFWQATQPISASSLPLPAGAATAANQSIIIGHIDGIETLLSGTLTVSTGLTPLTDAQLRATAVPASVATLPSVTLSSESGFLSYRNTALTNTAVAVKASAGSVMGWNFINVNTVPVYVKFYNIAAASVTVGTSAVLLTIAVPPASATSPGIFFLEPGLIPVEVFSTAIAMACVTGLADNNNTAPSTAIHASVRYK